MNSPIPKLQKDILAKLKKASKTFQAEKMKPFEPITHIFTINLKKPEAIMEKMKQVFSNTTDQLLKLTGNPSEKAIYVIGDDDVFTLTNYLDFKLEKKGRLSKPRILKLSLDSEEAPPEVIKYQPPPWIIAQLQRFYKSKEN
jgi:hypothetical protein